MPGTLLGSLALVALLLSVASALQNGQGCAFRIIEPADGQDLPLGEGLDARGVFIVVEAFLRDDPASDLTRVCDAHVRLDGVQLATLSVRPSERAVLDVDVALGEHDLTVDMAESEFRVVPPSGSPAGSGARLLVAVACPSNAEACLAKASAVMSESSEPYGVALLMDSCEEHQAARPGESKLQRWRRQRGGGGALCFRRSPGSADPWREHLSPDVMAEGGFGGILMLDLGAGGSPQVLSTGDLCARARALGAHLAAPEARCVDIGGSAPAALPPQDQHGWAGGGPDHQASFVRAFHVPLSPLVWVSAEAWACVLSGGSSAQLADACAPGGLLSSCGLGQSCGIVRAAVPSVDYCASGASTSGTALGAAPGARVPAAVKAGSVVALPRCSGAREPETRGVETIGGACDSLLGGSAAQGVGECVRVRLPFSDAALEVFVGEQRPEHMLGFWGDAATGGWELNTFRAFNQEITRNTAYVGFGEWVGPTGLWAMQRARLAVLVEPDARIVRELCVNVQSNLGRAARAVRVEHRCVWVRSEAVDFAESGDSMSGIPDPYYVRTGTSRRVECLTLPDLLAHHGVPGCAGRLFVKVDCEGCEWDVVPSLLPWLKSLDGCAKPVLFVSTHEDGRDGQRQGMAAVFNLYKYFAVLIGPVARPSFTASGLRPSNGMCAEGVRLQRVSDVPFTADRVVGRVDFLLTDDPSFSAELCGDPLPQL